MNSITANLVTTAKLELLEFLADICALIETSTSPIISIELDVKFLKEADIKT